MAWNLCFFWGGCGWFAENVGKRYAKIDPSETGGGTLNDIDKTIPVTGVLSTPLPSA